MMSFNPSFSDKGVSNDDPKVRVIVVDDSLVIRGFITRALSHEAGFDVVGTAANGKAAIDVLARTPADVVILDIEMPVMDGLTAIPKLKEIDPAVQIIMASTLTQKNAEISMKALSLGATDYLPKPSAREMAVPNAFLHDLREKVKTLGIRAWRNNVRKTPFRKTVVADAAPVEKKAFSLRAMTPHFKPEIIAIGSSTGGPQALFSVIRAMGKELLQPVVITQHMPPSFTTILASHIARECGVSCEEAKEGMPLQPGHYYVAPGDFHLLVTKKLSGPMVELAQTPAENYCRPAVDPMLRSLVGVYGSRILVVILTGMGQDGMKGSEDVVRAGGAVLAQNEATSVVWGMPGAVAMAGLCSAVLPVGEIGPVVKRIAIQGGAGSMGDGSRA
ncbi:MAG: chemotaxis response regulator protein-glutamate methylesterase [Alphaproteobacteria bacterium]|nr:chemotaxis response regulator protein-glutamate methylesterase [Alphaproteobacteria bacterium]